MTAPAAAPAGTGAAPARWLLGGAPADRAATRLFCFPFAGGSGSAYCRWFRSAPAGLHINAIEYPGHGARMAEDPVPSMPRLVTEIADRIEPLAAGRYAFFGHSMGGVVAHEVALELRARSGRLPAHLFVSGVGAPGGPVDHRSLADLSDADVLAELRSLGGTPPELLEHPELAAQAIRVLRADSAALAAHRPRPGAPLDVPITAFGGRSDDLVPAAALRGWARQTSRGCRIRFFPGDHFFLFPAAPQLLGAIAAALEGNAENGAQARSQPVRAFPGGRPTLQEDDPWLDR